MPTQQTLRTVVFHCMIPLCRTRNRASRPETQRETMVHGTALTQESRTEKVAIAVTATEKRAVRALAALRGTDESNLCRTLPIAEIVAEFERLRDQAGEG